MDSELPEKEGSANSTQTDDVTKTDLLPTLADSGASDPANPEEISVQTVSEQTEKAEPTVGTSSVNDQESEESLLQKELKQVMKTTESEAAAGVLESQDSVDEDMDKIISKETEVLEPTVHGETTPTSDPGSPKGGSLEPRSEGSISPESQSVVHKDHSKKLLDETKETMEDPRRDLKKRPPSHPTANLQMALMTQIKTDLIGLTIKEVLFNEKEEKEITSRESVQEILNRFQVLADRDASNRKEREVDHH